LQNILVRHEDVKVILDFHLFDIHDIHLFIGHPIEILLMDAPTQSKIDVRLWKETHFVQIARAQTT